MNKTDQTEEVSLQEAGQKAEGIANIIRLVILIVVIIGGGSKAWFEIQDSKDRDIQADKKIEAYKSSSDKKIEAIKDNLKEQISALKKKSEEDHKTIQDIKTDVAVTRSQLQSLIQQGVVVLNKLEKMNDRLNEK